MPRRRRVAGVHVEEAEDLGLGVAEGVEDRAGLRASMPSGRSTTIFMPSAHSRW